MPSWPPYLFYLFIKNSTTEKPEGHLYCGRTENTQIYTNIHNTEKYRNKNKQTKRHLWRRDRHCSFRVWTFVFNNSKLVSTGLKLTQSMYQERVWSGVTRVGVIRGGNWRCNPYFPLKTGHLFSHRYKVMTLFRSRLVATPQLPSSDIVLSSVLCKFSHNFFSFGCHPLDEVTLGGPPHPPTCPLVTLL